MKIRTVLCLSLVGAVLLYGVTAWPILPRYFNRGIPAGAHPAPAAVQPAFPGDHLQLMYHFWLAGDMLTGGTALFYNPYEFNTGDDQERFAPGSYYVPFSLLYAALAGLFGRAAGWNLASLLTFWMTLLLTWRLARRYTAREWVAAMAALVGLMLPFYWINLFGGSPAGFAMLWTPAIWLGVDLAVRNRSIGGGVLAGVGIWMASWCDTHVFFFSVLALPAWVAMALLADRDFRWRRPRHYLQVALALAPVALGVGIALGSPWLFNWLTLRVTGAPPEERVLAERSLREVRLYSPTRQGFFDWRGRGLNDHVFIGLAIPVLLLLGGVVWLLRPAREKRRLALWCLVVGVMGVVGLLALGVHGPRDGMLLLWARRLVPPYRMVRQTAKIFVLMPSLIAVAVACAGEGLSRRSLGAGVLIFLLLPAALEYGLRVQPVISLMPPIQAAYEQVARDAAAAQRQPRAVVVPLWPGDTHYTSMYQHFASMHRIRLLNGYRPFVRQPYYTNVFQRLVSINQGWLTDDQIDHLRDMHVDYVILHEDLFPEKVSPFAVTHTIRRLKENPRLRLLRQAQSVWAFEILPAAGARAPAAPHWDVYAAARHWDATRSRYANVRVIADESAAGNAVLHMPAAGESRFQTGSVWVAPTPDLRWLVRARGYGVLAPELISDGLTLPLPGVDVNSDEWRWHAVAADILDGYAPLSLRMFLDAGLVEVDVVLLTAGNWPAELAPGESISIPAPCFFHAGYIDMQTDTVTLRRDHDPRATIFYGPKLPLPAGDYRVELDCESPADPGLLLAQFNIRQRGSDPLRWTPVFSGYPVEGAFSLAGNLPFSLELLFHGEDDLTIRKVVFTRLEDHQAAARPERQ